MSWTLTRARDRRSEINRQAIDQRPQAITARLTAATALAHGLIVVARNARDFAFSSCELLSPWSI